MLDREIITLDQIVVVGISTTTSNEIELTKDAKIIPLHDLFVSEGISSKIKDQQDDRMIALYTDYENQEYGNYTYGIGHSVNQLLDLPDGFSAFEIPAGQYLKVTTERGFLSDVLPEAWKGIWQMSESVLGARRAYTTDFEFHNYDDSTSSDLQVDIYLSILPT